MNDMIEAELTSSSDEEWVMVKDTNKIFKIGVNALDFKTEFGLPKMTRNKEMPRIILSSKYNAKKIPLPSPKKVIVEKSPGSLILPIKPWMLGNFVPLPVPIESQIPRSKSSPIVNKIGNFDNSPTSVHRHLQQSDSKRDSSPRSPRTTYNSGIQKKLSFALRKCGSAIFPDNPLNNNNTMPTRKTVSFKPHPVKVISNYKSPYDGHLNLKEGEVLLLLSHMKVDGWSRGKRVDGMIGIFPTNVVEKTTDLLPFWEQNIEEESKNDIESITENVDKNDELKKEEIKQTDIKTKHNSENKTHTNELCAHDTISDCFESDQSINTEKDAEC